MINYRKNMNYILLYKNFIKIFCKMHFEKVMKRFDIKYGQFNIIITE